MPFKPPWRDYLAGDFFYGFSGARAKLITQLTNGRTTYEIESSKEVAWLDQLLTGTAVHDVTNMNMAFAAYCRSNSKWKEVVASNYHEIKAGDDDVENNRRWRRKSKAGLDFLVRHHVSVHFAIDYGMDWKAVVSKPSSAEETATPFGKPQYQYKVEDVKYRIITYAEIRYIYRNRGERPFQDNIQFWYQDTKGGRFTAGAPPWERDPEPWKLYTPTSEEQGL